MRIENMSVSVGKRHAVFKLLVLFACSIYNSLPVSLLWVKKLDIQSGGSDTVLLMEDMRGTHKVLSDHVIGFLVDVSEIFVGHFYTRTFTNGILYFQLTENKQNVSFIGYE